MVVGEDLDDEDIYLTPGLRAAIAGGEHGSKVASAPPGLSLLNNNIVWPPFPIPAHSQTGRQVKRAEFRMPICTLQVTPGACRLGKPELPRVLGKGSRKRDGKKHIGIQIQCNGLWANFSCFLETARW